MSNKASRNFTLLEFLSLFIAGTFSTFLTPKFEIYYQFQETSIGYLQSYFVFTLVMGAFFFLWAYFMKPFNIGNIKSLDYVYYTLAIIGVFFLVHTQANQIRELRFKDLELPNSQIQKQEYISIKSLCEEPLHKNQDLCEVYENILETYPSDNIDLIREQLNVLSKLANKNYWFAKLKIIVIENETKEAKLLKFQDELVQIYKAYLNKYKYLSSKEPFSLNKSSIFMLLYWPYVLIFALLVKLFKTLIEHQKWTTT